MTEFRGSWSGGEVETFLNEMTIPVRIATHKPDGSLWVVTLWYRHRNGSIECATQADADIVRFLRADSEIAFDISTNRMPYRGVRGHGTATVSDSGGTAVLEDLVERYLGGADSALAEWLLADDREEVRVRLEPRVIYSWDYGDRMGDIDDDDAT